jgi:hypothetical protein
MSRDHLFASPSVWEGIARVFDFGDTLTEFNVSESAAQADFLAIRSDWLAVGDDLAAAISMYASEGEQAESPAAA